MLAALGMKEMSFLISPYIIFADVNPRTPDMQAETGQAIYFWNCILKGVVLQKPDFFVLPFMKPEKRQKHFLREGGF